VIFLGIAVVGESDLMGLAHLTLIPLEALGIILLAAWFPWSRAAVAFLLVGCAIDFSFGIFLNLRVQNMENTPQRTVFSGLTLDNNRVSMGAQGPDTLGGAAWLNWFWKNRDDLHRQWIHQLDGLPQTPSVRRMTDQMHVLIGQNAHDFGGWYGRHGGRITFIGDHLSGPSFAGLDAPSVLLLLLFAGMLRAFWKEWVRFVPSSLPAAAAVPLHQPVRRKTAVRRR
jgi:hypothetical protein